MIIKRIIRPAPAHLKSGPELPGIIMDGLDGFLGEFVAYATRTARSPQPFLALGAAIAAVGAAAGRRYRTPTDIRTNPMILALAGSGGGKERPRAVLADLFSVAGLDRYVGGSKIGSSAGLLTAIREHPVVLFALDEVGHMLGVNSGRNAGTHKLEIMPLLTELYSKAAGNYLGTNYGDNRAFPRTILNQPHVVLYGVTVPGTLWGAFRSGALSDGTLARYLVFETPDDYPDVNKRPPLEAMPLDMVESVRNMAGVQGGGNLQGVIPMISTGPACDIVTVEFDDDAAARMDAISDEELALKRRYAGNGHVVAFWARFAEHVARMALIKAISRDAMAPLVGLKDTRWAEALVRHCIQHVLEKADDHIADNDLEANSKRIRKLIRDAGPAGITTSGLTTRTRGITSRDRTQLLAALVEGGDIVGIDINPKGSGGRPGKRYAAVGHWQGAGLGDEPVDAPGRGFR